MLAFLGAVFGFVGGFLPEVIKFFKAREDRKHELAILNIQLEAQKLGHTQRLEEINVQADVMQEQLALQASRVEKSGVRWVDALLSLVVGLVRPTITYSYFGLYAIVKWASFGMYKQAGLVTQSALLQIWTETDMAIFSTVIGFWFSGRLLQKFLNGKRSAY